MNKTAFSLCAALILLSSLAHAQEANLFSPLWSDTIKGAVGKVSLLDLYVTDINDDGISEAVAITSGSAGSSETKNRNRVIAFSGTGGLLWDYKVDDVIKSQVMHDLNNDRSQEFVISSGQTLNGIQRGSIRIIDSTGNLLRSYDSTSIARSLAITDLNRDGYYQILGGSTSRAVLSLIYGERVWMYPPEGSGVLPAPADRVTSWDVDNDGNEEIIVGADDVYYLNGDGKFIKSYDPLKGASAKKGFKYMKVLALSAKRLPDVVAVTKDDRIFAFRVEEPHITPTSKTYTSINESWSLSIGSEINSIIPFDVDKDGFPELILGCANGRVYTVDNNGQVMWEYPVNGDVGDIDLGDIDGDNVTDIIVGTYAGSIYSLDLMGNFKWKQDTLGPILKIGVGKISDDDTKEIVVVKENNVVEAYSLNQTFVLRKRADNYFAVAQEYYLTSEYAKSREYFILAKQNYLDLGYEKGVSDCERLIKQVDLKLSENIRKDADLYYNKAQDYFISGDYESSLSFVGKAKEIYEELGDSEKVLKCELLELRIKSVRIPPVTVTTNPVITQPTTPGILPGSLDISISLISVAGLIILALIVMRYVKRKRTRDDELIGDNVDKSIEELEVDLTDKVKR